jgi:hypothetical protein
MSLVYKRINDQVESVGFRDPSDPEMEFTIMRRWDGEVIFECPLNVEASKRWMQFTTELATEVALFILRGSPPA